MHRFGWTVSDLIMTTFEYVFVTTLLQIWSAQPNFSSIKNLCRTMQTVPQSSYNSSRTVLVHIISSLVLIFTPIANPVRTETFWIQDFVCCLSLLPCLRIFRHDASCPALPMVTLGSIFYMLSGDYSPSIHPPHGSNALSTKRGLKPNSATLIHDC